MSLEPLADKCLIFSRIQLNAPPSVIGSLAPKRLRHRQHPRSSSRGGEAARLELAPCWPWSPRPSQTGALAWPQARPRWTAAWRVTKGRPGCCTTTAAGWWESSPLLRAHRVDDKADTLASTRTGASRCTRSDYKLLRGNQGRVAQRRQLEHRPGRRIAPQRAPAARRAADRAVHR
jgi:hypothetical protein